MSWNPPSPPTPGQVGQAIGNAVNQGVNTGTQVVNAAANALNPGGSGAPDPGKAAAAAVLILDVAVDCVAAVVTGVVVIGEGSLAITGAVLQFASTAVKIAVVIALAMSAICTVVENGPALLDNLGFHNAAADLRRYLANGWPSVVLGIVAIELEIVVSIINAVALSGSAFARLLQSAQHLHAANRSQLANSNSAGQRSSLQPQLPAVIPSASANGAELERLNLTLARDLQHAEHLLRRCTLASARLPDRRLFHAVHHLQNQLVICRPKIFRAIEAARQARMQKIVHHTPGVQKPIGMRT